MPYAPSTWSDFNFPALSAASMNKIEQGIADAHSDISQIGVPVQAGDVPVITGTSSVATTSNVDSVAVPRPSSAADGDLLVAIITSGESALASEMGTIPAGWVRSAWPFETIEPGKRLNAVFTKTAASDDPAEWTWGHPGSNKRWACAILAVRGSGPAAIYAYAGPNSVPDNVGVLPVVAADRRNTLAIGMTHMVATSGKDTRAAFAGWDAQVQAIGDWGTSSTDSLTVVSRSAQAGDSVGGERAVLNGDPTVVGFPGADASAVFVIAPKDPLIALPTITVAAADADQMWRSSAEFLCTGTDDDTVIQAALDAASGAAGTSGTLSGQALVQLSPGNYSTTSAISVPSRTWLRGSGRGSTMIRAAAGHAAIGSATDGVVRIDDALGDPYDFQHLSDFTIHGGYFDLNGFYSHFTESDAAKDDDNIAGQPDAATILERLGVVACGREGVHISFVQASTSWWLDKVRVFSCGDSGDYAGFYIAGTDCWVTDCEVGSQGATDNTTSVGFHVLGSDNTYSHCIAWVTKGDGFVVEGAKQRLTGCNSHHSRGSGFVVKGNGNRNIFTGCLSYNNADTGFLIQSVNTVTFVGCHAFDDGDSFVVTGRPMSYGFRTTNTFNNSAGIVISDCTTFGNGMIPLGGTAHDDKGGHLISIAHTGSNQNGTAGSVYTLRWRDGTAEFVGDGTPEGKTSPFSTAAPPGSTYRRRDGGAGTTFYVKETGTGNTGWVAK